LLGHLYMHSSIFRLLATEYRVAIKSSPNYKHSWNIQYERYWKWFLSLERTTQNCGPAGRKMASLPQKAMSVCCGTGRQNKWFKSKDITAWNMKAKHQEESPISSDWCLQRQAVFRYWCSQEGLQGFLAQFTEINLWQHQRTANSLYNCIGSFPYWAKTACTQETDSASTTTWRWA
jgi:hypothetical protein